MEVRANYDICITTSNAYQDAGFDGEVKLQLIGKSWKATEKQYLKSKHFKKGAHANFQRRMLDVGVPEFVRFELDGSTENQWACDNVIVTYKKVEVRFPIYDWIETEITAASGKAFTYTQAGPELRAVRLEEVERAKGLFAWIPKPTEEDIGWGIPRYVNASKVSNLPKIFQKADVRKYGFVNTFLQGIVSLFKGELYVYLTTLFNFVIKDFQKFYRYIKAFGRHVTGSDPPFIKRWDTDVEFGRQQIMGVTPLALKRCNALPDGCQITDEILALNGKTLEAEMKEGRIFIGDYSTVFDEVERNTNDAGNSLHCPHAIGLFRPNKNDDLVPIAIQLIPGDAESIFTPRDDKNDWLLAKMYYRVAAANIHEWYYHFLLTHNLMEPFAVGLFRNIPRSHPLYKLLRPHLQTVSVINTEARLQLIGPGTLANKAFALLGINLAREGFKTFNMKEMILPKVIKERGLDDKNVLPKNYFRDDSLKLWPIVENFVKSMLELYYTSDQDVVDDKDLQAFALDVAIQGLGWQDGNTKGMEKEITTLDQLVELCTILIYTSSAGHAAVNFPQFQTYQFIPNAPGGMRLAPHKKGDKVDEKRILDALPDTKMAKKQIQMTYLLSEYAEDEIYLGNYPKMLFTEDRAQAVITKFKEDLDKYQQEIIQRNDKCHPHEAYKWLLPEHVPNSIAV